MSQAGKTVAVIGAGIVGVSTAIWLQRDGHKVILIDREGPAAGTSYGNGGILASCSIVPVTVPGLLRKAPKMLFDPNEPLFLKWRYLPKLMPWLIKYLSTTDVETVRYRARVMTQIIGDSLNDHQALAQGTPAARYIVPSDYVYVYRDRAHFEGDALGWELRKENGFEWEELEGEDWRAYDPSFGPANSFGAKMGGHGRISDPGEYVKALAAHAEAEGAQFIKANVDDVVYENGRVIGLRAGGETIDCDAAVLAAGAWSKKLSDQFGLPRPTLESERGYHIELWEPSMMPRAACMVAAGKFVATPMDGRLRLAGVVEFGGLEAPPSEAPFKLLEQNIREAMPDLKWKKIERWMGHRPSMADSIPVIGKSPTLGGAFAAFGHDHVGMTGGPKTGRLVAQMVSGKHPNLDLEPYSPARFTR